MATAFVVPASASALWIDSGRLNVQPTDSAEFLSIAGIGSVPYVSWNEYTPPGSAHRLYLFTDRFSGGQWSGVGGLIDQLGSWSTLANVGGTPYLAFVSQTRGFVVFRLVNGVWTQVGGPITSPGYPEYISMTSDGTTPWVTWDDGIGHIFAADFYGGAWHTTSALNGDTGRFGRFPSITIVDGVPWVAWYEQTGRTYQGPYGAVNVGITRVARIGVTVQHLGSPDINISRDAGRPSITTIGGVPYVAWAEDVTDGGWKEIRVARFNGTGWAQVGASANVDPTARADSPSITGVNGVPWVAWEEPSGGSSYVHVKEFAGGLWEPAGDAPRAGAATPAITTAGDTPYVAYLVFGTYTEIHVMYPQRLSPLALTGTKANRTKRGVTFVVRLKRRANVRIDIARPTVGRVVAGKCVAATRSNRRKPSCTRSRVLGTLRFKGKPGVNRFAFNGRLSSSASLKPGRYVAKITAATSGGRPSIPLWVRFMLP